MGQSDNIDKRELLVEEERQEGARFANVGVGVLLFQTALVLEVVLRLISEDVLFLHLLTENERRNQLIAFRATSMHAFLCIPSNSKNGRKKRPEEKFGAVNCFSRAVL